MRVGIPKEIKVHEYRVGMVPSGVRELIDAGHDVFVQRDAGAGVGFSDAMYEAAGAQLLEYAEDVFDRADLIIKVKEPQLGECKFLRADQTLFTYLHLAAAPDLVQALLQSGVTAIAYETVTASDGSLPLLTPMSEVAGRMSVQVGAMCLQKAFGGSGVLLGGVPGVSPGRVVVLGGGVAGSHAAEMAVGLTADVTVVDRSTKRLREIAAIFGSRLKTEYATAETIERLVANADLVIGAVLIAGAAAPKLVTRNMLGHMRKGSVMVDISIDQGGCFETSRPTTHADPTFEVDGIVHYCVTNMPGAFARTSTVALTNATLPHIRALAELGTRQAMSQDKHLGSGLNIYDGHIAHQAVAQALGMEFLPFTS